MKNTSCTIATLALSALALTATETRAQSVYATPYAFTNFAGMPGSQGSTDGLGNNAQFIYPLAVAVDGADNLYVADLDRVRRITPAGLVTTLAGGGGEFGGVWGVAVDTSSNVYVADFGSDTVRKITPAGVLTTLAGSPGQSGSVDGVGSAARFNSPRSVAVDSLGNVYVADTSNQTVRKITPDGVVTTFAGMAGQSGSANGTGSTARFNYPWGIAADGAGNVYVADSGNDTVRKISPARVVTTMAGSALQGGSTDGTGSAARFGLPSGLAVDSAGNVYVTDSNYDTIRKITPAGLVTTLAGSPLQFGSADGIGSAARFSNPSGVTVDSAGNAYVADSNNARISKGKPPVTTGPLDTWHVRPTGTSRELTMVAHDGSRLIAVGWGGTVFTSSDGATWSPQNPGTALDLYSVAYGNGLFVAVGQTILSSADGRSWTQRTTESGLALETVVYVNGMFIAIGDNGQMRVSTNGLDWSARSPGTTRNLYGLAYGNGLFVLTCSGSLIRTSPDGIAWTDGYSVAGGPDLNGARFAKGLFLVHGSSGTVLTSTDGLSWTQRNSGTVQDLATSAYGAGTFLIVGVGGTILSSSDAIVWTSRPSGTAALLLGVDFLRTATNGSFVVVGDSGTLLQSDPIPLAPIPPPSIISPVRRPDGTFQFSFINTNEASFAVLAANDVAQPAGNWTALGAPVELSPGLFSSPTRRPQTTWPDSTASGRNKAREV